MIWTDDPIGDAERYSAAMDRAERELPRCKVCGNRILGSVYDDGKGNDLCLLCWEEMWEDEEQEGRESA